jgi:hypothetical protein
MITLGVAFKAGLSGASLDCNQRADGQANDWIIGCVASFPGGGSRQK